MPIFPGMATTLIPEDELCVEFPAMSVGLADGCGGIVYEVSDLRIILRDEATRIYGGFRPACLSPSSLRRFFWLSSPLPSVPRVTPLPENRWSGHRSRPERGSEPDCDRYGRSGGA